MTLSLKASCSIWWVSAVDFFKIEAKFDADSLLLKIRHVGYKKIDGSLKHNLTKVHWTL
jgi:hypothetical protein